jgi:large subunit ribosomal protein L18
MPHGSRYRVPLRRRREQKTDYQARKAFVVSHRPRLVARSSLKNTVAQIVVAKPIGDFVLASAHSKELVKTYSWKAATGTSPQHTSQVCSAV